MKLYLTASRSKNSFIIFDLKTNACEAIPYQETLDCKHLKDQGRKTFRPFGIYEDEEFVYIASNDRLGKFSRDNYDFKGLVKNVPLFINTHQILKHNGVWFTANSSNDSITISNEKTVSFFDVSAKRLVSKVSTPLNANELDDHHINSVSIINENLYVLAHNNGRSDIYVLDIQTLAIKEIIQTPAKCAHGLEHYNGHLYTLCSGTNSLCEITLTNKVLHKLPVTGFLRGLRIKNDKAFFVSSMNLKKDNETHHSVLYVIDLNNKKIENSFDLSPIEVVEDIYIRKD